MLGLQTWGFILDLEKPLVAAFPPSLQNRRSFFLPFLPAAGAYCQLPGVVVWSERLPGV